MRGKNNNDLYKSVFSFDETFFKSFEEEIDVIKKRQQEKIDRINKFNKEKKNEYSPNFTSAFKRNIFKRDNYTCQLCNRKEDLTVHHIHYQKRYTIESECICLCRGCNSRVNEKKKRKFWTDYFKNLVYYGKRQ